MVMKIEVLTPQRIIFSTTADEVILPTESGLIGILDGHAPLITNLDTGLMRLKHEGKWVPLILLGGVAEIQKDNIIVLVNGVEEIFKKDKKKASEEVEKARLALEAAETSKKRLDALVELKRSLARLEANNYLKDDTDKN